MKDKKVVGMSSQFVMTRLGMEITIFDIQVLKVTYSLHFLQRKLVYMQRKRYLCTVHLKGL